MKNRSVVAATMVVLTSLFAGEAVYAAPVHSPVLAVFGHAKTVSFSVRNDTKAPLKLMAGTTEMTLEPGKTVAVKLTVGEKVVSEQATVNYPAGSVIVTAGPELSDTTVALN
jgi:hypothetical protein